MSNIFDKAYIYFLIIATLTNILVFIVEYIFDFTPCILCLLERAPYLLISFCAIIFLNTENMDQKLFLHKIVIFLIAISIIISLYHVGLEHDLFPNSEFCTTNTKLPTYLTNNEFRNFLNQEELKLCKNPSIMIGAFSLVEINLIANFLYLIYCLYLIIPISAARRIQSTN